MLFTTHALTGSAIGVASGNPVVGLVAGIVSHHLADAIPHFDTGSFYVGTPLQDDPDRRWSRGDWLVAIVDLTIGSLVGLLMWSKHDYSSSFFFGGLGGILPDLILVVPFWKTRILTTKIGGAYAKFHRKFHHTSPISQWYLGITTNLALIALSLIYLLK